VVNEQLLGCIAESVTTDEEREKLSGTQVTDLIVHFVFHSVGHDKNPPLCTKGRGERTVLPCQHVGLQM
jgi:hypothetical protein